MQKIGQIKLTEAMAENNIDQLAKSLGTSRQTLYHLRDGVFNHKPGINNYENMRLTLARSLKNILKIDYDDWFECGQSLSDFILKHPKKPSRLTVSNWVKKGVIDSYKTKDGRILILGGGN